MGNFIHLDESLKGRVAAIRKENERLITLLKTKGVLRDSMFPGWYVIYTERGAIDLHPSALEPCLKLYKDVVKCKCINCTGLCGCGCGDLVNEVRHG